MISKSQAKFIKSLQLKKYRKQEQCFVVDGEKGVDEVLRSDYEIEMVVVGESFFKKYTEKLNKLDVELITASDNQLAQLSSFQTNQSLLAVVKQKPNHIPQLSDDEYALVLDDIRDPGNLGSIIRSADWFGMRKIFASEHTADFYNPKVINATMGSFTRVKFGYCDLTDQLKKAGMPIYGTFMDGDNIHDLVFAAGGLIVIGNEANGISTQVQQLITQRIAIPGVQGAESLNAAVATGIVLDNWSRSKK